MALSFDLGLIEALSLWALLLAVGFSGYVMFGVRPGRRPLERLRTHFVLGVPWGTLSVVALLLVVYYVLQGAGQIGGPVVVGFRSWSYTYPLGMILAPFAHSGDGHLFGNLFSTVAFAPVAEYAWSHYPTRRGSRSFGGLVTNPFARIVLFVVAVLLIGLATSLLIPGALIGFSGVVFAFAGYALVTKPITAVFALVAERAIRLLYFTVENPVLQARGRIQFITPFWADVAVQGHALGLVLGVLAGFLVVRRREEWPDVGLVWVAVSVFAVAQALYAFYWFRGGTEYILFRGIGLAAVLGLAGVVAVAFSDGDHLLVSRIDLSRREAATGILLAFVLAMSVAAVPYNTVAVSSGAEADTGIQVRDYTVTYAEDVPNRYVGAIDVPLVGDVFAFNTSGVIVTSDDRNAWEAVVAKNRLAVRGRVTVPVGGLGWRETVVVNRTTWSVIDGPSTYKVFMRRSDGPRKQVFTASPARVPAVINDSQIAIRPADPGYQVVVSRNDSVIDTGQIPGAGENVTVGDIRFNRTGDRLRALYGGTRVPIAKFEMRRQRQR
ncbi:MAG: hypothetical protein ACI8XM_002802 [Haloarculaceae archaeon]|jgi:hypothetical protein